MKKGKVNLPIWISLLIIVPVLWTILFLGLKCFVASLMCVDLALCPPFYNCYLFSVPIDGRLGQALQSYLVLAPFGEVALILTLTVKIFKQKLYGH